MFCCWVLVDKFYINVNDVDFSLNSRKLDLAYSINYCSGVFLITCSNGREKNICNQKNLMTILYPTIPFTRKPAGRNGKHKLSCCCSNSLPFSWMTAL